jgi:hypothetical protein
MKDAHSNTCTAMPASRALRPIQSARTAGLSMETANGKNVECNGLHIVGKPLPNI